MKLIELKLKNFRGYKDVAINFTKDLNLIIGRNDVGKSTIMDALEIFFNGENKNAIVKPDIDDLNIYNDEKVFEIVCIFEIDNDRPVYIDSTHSTNLIEEHLLNKDGYLEIVKIWNCKGNSLTASNLSVFLNTYYPVISDIPLILLKKADLQKKLNDYKESISDYENIHKNTNSIMRKALYKHLINEETEYEEKLIEIKQLDAGIEKDVWKRLKDNLPLFFFFQSDRSNSDADGEVQNPLKVATKKALANIQYKLDEIENEIEEVVSKIGEETIEKLSEFDSNIASTLTTNLNKKAWDSIFSFSLTGDNDIPLNKRGSGVRRLILLSYFRAEAERVSKEKDSNDIIYAIEEPETAQHPDYQKMILESLNAIANTKSHQVLVTTHTPEIAKMVDLDSITFIQKNDLFPEVVKDTDDKIYKISKSLGILPTIQSKVVICVEGENDVKFLMNLNQSIIELKNIIDLRDKEIPVIPLSGGKLINWINNNYLKNSNVIEYHIYDSDEKKYINKIDEINAQQDGRRFGVNTRRTEMENYIPLRLVEERFNIDLAQQIGNWDELDVPKHLINLCMTHIEDTSEREKIIKSILNSSLTKEITLDDLKAMNNFVEVENWFKQIASLYNTGAIRIEQHN